MFDAEFMGKVYSFASCSVRVPVAEIHIEENGLEEDRKKEIALLQIVNLRQRLVGFIVDKGSKERKRASFWRLFNGSDCSGMINMTRCHFVEHRSKQVHR